MWRDTKRILFIFILGLGTGGYLVHTYYEGILSYADRGYCSQRDPAKTRYWFNCLDGAVALELQQREIQRATQVADPIGDLIRATEAVKPKSKVTKVKQ